MSKRALLILLTTAIIISPIMFRPVVHGFDTVAYFSWLRSPIIDGNLNVADEFTYYGYGDERGTTATGYTYNEWAIGSAILWLPFFLMAHGLSLLARYTNVAFVTDGYAPQYIVSISLASFIYAFIGILLTYRLCRRYFTAEISLLAVITTWLSGTLIFYMYSHPLMSHANDAFAFALFATVWHKTRQNTSMKGALLRGVAASLCTLVRQMNAVFVFVILSEYLWQAITNYRGGQPFLAAIRTPVLKTVYFSAGWWLTYLPQLVVWRIVYGHWIELNPYQAGAGFGFTWFEPKVFNVLFSTQHGLFIWTPLMLISVLGWLYFWQIDRGFTLFLAACFILQLYVVSSWSVWNAGAAFGQRFFTNMFTGFTLGFAGLCAHLQFKWSLSRPKLALTASLFIIWNGLLIVRYVVEDIPRDSVVPLDHFILGQFTVIPRYFGRIIEILLTRT